MVVLTFIIYHTYMVRDFKKNFGKRVKYYRGLLGLSQERLAELVGISSNTVGYIERGKNSISMAKLPALCSALQVEPYQLFLNDEFVSDINKIDQIHILLERLNSKQLGVLYNLIKNLLDL